MKYLLKTFGCQQNIADSERITAYYEARGYEAATDEAEADVVVINTCVVRERAEEKVFGLWKNITAKNSDARLVITGCLVGAAVREPSGKMMKRLRTRLPNAELLPLEEVGFEYEAKRTDKKHAWLPISNGCNNYCTYCIVPFSRGRERSREFEEIISEARELADKGYEEITLLGQNVNSYGSDIVGREMRGARKENDAEYILSDGAKVKPVMVKHLGRYRIPTLFPHLLRAVAQMGFSRVTFISSNPWDFSDELIAVIAENENIDRTIHLPVQSGDSKILEGMNRWYTREEYFTLTQKIRARVSGVEFTTDIIVGFPGETEEQFQNTADLVRRVGFVKSYTACYSPRPGTASTKLPDDIAWEEKKRRFHILDEIVRKSKVHKVKSP